MYGHNTVRLTEAVDFPRQGVRQNRKEHDLGDAFAEEEEYPSLADM